MFKKLLIGALIVLFSFGFVSCATVQKTPEVSVVETCSVPKGAIVLVLREAENSQLMRAELNGDIDNLEILESIPANVAAELSGIYPGDWSDAKLTTYMNGSEKLLIIVRTEHLWNCVIRP